MTLDLATFRDLIAEANLAPSVHNTQPTRWRLTPDGDVLVLEDETRRLRVGDPEGRDAGVSHGCAVEGFSIAAAERGLTVAARLEADAVMGLTLAARGPPDALAELVQRRRTYRGRFDGRASSSQAVAQVAESCPDLVVVTRPEQIAGLAALYDAASLRWFRNAAYRAELLSWMRLSRRHPAWSRDGLNAEAMEMSGLEAAGAGFVLLPGVFEALDRLGAAAPLVAEAAVVRTASAIALFHRPADETPFETGRRFYRVWLAFTRSGLSASPMAVLADDPEASAAIASQFGLGGERRLITAFRLGVAPARDLTPKPRLPVDALIA